MRQSLVLLFALLVLGCTLSQGHEFVEYDDTQDLPVDKPFEIARGYRRELLAQPMTVTVGYDAKAQFKIPTDAKDSLAKLQQALDKVAANGGGTLLISPGTYILSGQLFIKSSKTKVQGAGMGKTILKLADKAAKFSKTGFLSGNNLKSVTISSLTLDGNKKNQVDDEVESYGRYGLYISPNDDLHINKIAVINFQMYGIDPPARNVDPTKKYDSQLGKKRTISVTNCVASFNNYDGIIIDTAVGVYVNNNTAEGNGRYGIQLCTGSWNGEVSNNIVKNNGYGAKEPKWKYLGGNGCGIMTDSNMLKEQLYVSTNIVYKGNKVIGSKRGGFCAKGAKNIQIVGNEINGADQCVWFSQLDGIQVTNNKCRKTKAFIVDKGDSKGVVLKGNTKSAN